jgi:hypothetical protein
MPDAMRPICLALLLLAGSVQADCATDAALGSYVFAWPFVDTTALRPRGGTTQGPDVRLREGPTEAWRRLQANGLSPREHDRRAILALAGDHRTSFDFLEVLVFESPHEPARPYRSWATERIYVLEDQPGFVSLQHLLVMSFIDDDGERHDPVVQKHWRQDWHYEPATIMEYLGDRVWRERTLGVEERTGRWAKTVFHVDDSPRYASLGTWRHSGAASFWSDSGTWRPLPQRELDVRDDYHVLAGTNRLTVLPAGWVHEQDNLKTVFAAPHVPDARVPYRAREIGVNRYERIEDFDFSAGDAYWRATRAFWAEVRSAWAARLQNGPVRVHTTCEDTLSFMRLFAFANALAAGRDVDTDELRSFVEDELDCITEPARDLPEIAPTTRTPATGAPPE